MSADAAPKSIPETRGQALDARGGRCEICNKYLLEDEFTAQPVKPRRARAQRRPPEEPGSPRGLADLPIDERNKAENLLLLCGDHHRVIDAKVRAATTRSRSCSS